MMTVHDFFRNVSLYGALIETWNQIGSDLVAQVELAGYNQPAFDPVTDAEIRPIVLILKSTVPLDDETRGFSVPANGDARVIDQEAIEPDQGDVGILELTCEVERYPTNDEAGETDYATLRLQFAAAEIVDAPAG